MELDHIENTNSRILVETASRLGIKVTLLNKQKMKLNNKIANHLNKIKKKISDIKYTYYGNLF